MTAISHALIGAAIAAKIPNPVVVAGTCVAVHLLCDMIPHWDWGTNWRLRPKSLTGALAIAETFVALVGTYLIFSPLVGSHLNLLLAIIFSLLPDWLEAPYYILMPNHPRVFYYVYKSQSLLHERLQLPWGAVTQIITVGVFLLAGFAI